MFVFRHGQFLMLHRQGTHGGDTWGVPGGNIELGESEIAAARREVAEEVGVLIANVTIAGVTHDTVSGKQYATTWLTSTLDVGEPKNLEPHKCREVRWCNFGDVPAPLFLWEGLRQADFFSKIIAAAV